MEHRIDLTLPPEATWAQLTSETFLRGFAREVGVQVDELTCTEQGDRALASMAWRFSTSTPGIPELARRFLPEEVHLRWAQSWGPLEEGRAVGGLEVQLLGRPSATSTGDCLLGAASSGSTLTTTTRTRAELPRPLAGRVESMIDRDLVGWIITVQGRVLERDHAG